MWSGGRNGDGGRWRSLKCGCCGNDDGGRSQSPKCSRGGGSEDGSRSQSPKCGDHTPGKTPTGAQTRSPTNVLTDLIALSLSVPCPRESFDRAFCAPLESGHVPRVDVCTLQSGNRSAEDEQQDSLDAIQCFSRRRSWWHCWWGNGAHEEGVDASKCGCVVI
jgi:hypothetical protein